MAENALNGTDSQHHKSMMYIITSIFDEAVLELIDLGVTEDSMSTWVIWFGKLFEWCGTGELESLPEDMRDIVANMVMELPAVT